MSRLQAYALSMRYSNILAMRQEQGVKEAASRRTIGQPERCHTPIPESTANFWLSIDTEHVCSYNYLPLSYARLAYYERLAYHTLRVQ